MGATIDATTLDAGGAGWTRDLARDLFPGPTTPFARTLLIAPAERAVRHVYAELGGQAPESRIWQAAGGYIYLNAAAITEADTSLYGAGWLGKAPGEAPGGLRGRLQAGGVIRRAQARQSLALGEVAGLQSRLSRWWAWVQGLKWTQADLLQVMEELEPHALAALQTYFLVRTALNAAAWAFDARRNEWLPDLPAELRPALTLGLPDQPTAQVVEAVLRAAGRAAADPERLATLARVSHRGPGEIRPDAKRWGDAPHLLDYLAEQGEARWTAAAAAGARERAWAAVQRGLSGGQFRQLLGLHEALAHAIRAADRTWDCLTLVMAAAQRWVGAATRETLAAGLISRPADVLYLELEELKQVATGEWHAGDREQVLAAVERRMREQPGPLALPPGGSPVIVAPGPCEGPRYCDSPQAVLPPPDAAWSSETADPGCAPLWAFAGCVTASGGDAWAPGMIAARVIGVPARMNV